MDGPSFHSSRDSTFETAPSFSLERTHRIQLHRAARRNVGREQRRADQHDTHNAERDRIGGTHLTKPW